MGINSKRPYGEMTYFYIDMGEILGIAPQGPPRKDRPIQREFTEDQEKAFEELHEQMQLGFRPSFSTPRSRREPSHGHHPATAACIA